MSATTPAAPADPATPATPATDTPAGPATPADPAANMPAATWQLPAASLSLARPLIMGVLNVTPDSFYDGGQHASTATAIAHAEQMLADGADLIDVGGESTRPGALELSLDAELARVLPVITHLTSNGAIVSVDTRHAGVAAAALAAGAAVINDVSGFRDAQMVRVLAQSDAACVVMHMQGQPQHMQESPHYDDVVAEVSAYLLAQASELEAQGVAPERICIDPGPGFGKTYEHNLQLLQATSQLASLGYPLMAAYSRKSFVGRLIGESDPSDRLIASVFVHIWAAAHGARILRVHDVHETVQILSALQIIGD